MAKRISKAKGFGLGAILLALPMVVYFEGVELTTYADPVGIPTACVGETDSEVVLRERFTLQECTAVLGASLLEHGQGVAECINIPLASHEAAAVLSWTYNVGVGAACKSTLVRMINQGYPATQWCAQLKRWIYAKGKVFRGLQRRREAEYRMCITGKWEAE